ncbi:COX15/CtaA family protein [Neobacillus niacini]|uniref:COX15/CtaA family protein n=1 Tax=Neobacillus niacini TaxID=86668 RepID=UPI00285C03E4|nr:COX15/CtaA family protein [Neobacillus niacini]MDR6999982.1 cytochrome c oxidase assembly protein subunit 15 [Neobacillus niacini]
MNKRNLALLTILLTYFLIVFGGYVASSNSGMGCGPEWPMCNGEIVPSLKGATLIEYLHRVIGALLGGLSLLLFFQILRSKLGFMARIVSFTMLGLLTVQVLLGAVVVVRDLPSIIITIHLLIAMLFMGCLIWIWRYPYLDGAQQVNQIHLRVQKSIMFHLNIVLGLTLLTLGFGAFIKHETYGLACGWLGCRQSIFPGTTPELFQSIHRGLAVVTALYLLFVTYYAFSKKWGRALRRRMLLCAFTVLLQLVIGAMVIITKLDLPWAVFHLAIATALFAFVMEARVYAGNLSIKTGPAFKPKVEEHGQRGSF